MPEYIGHRYEIERRERGNCGKCHGYEFHLVVDGEDVITASGLERRGYNGPENGGAAWVGHLKRYAKAYIDGLEARPDPENPGQQFNDYYREIVQRAARLEVSLRSLESGDFVRVSARNGEFAGCVEKVNDTAPGEGSYVVVIDADVFNGGAMEADTHTVTIDYEGPSESSFAHYVPNVVATADSRSLGPVDELVVEPVGVAQ